MKHFLVGNYIDEKFFESELRESDLKILKPQFSVLKSEGQCYPLNAGNWVVKSSTYSIADKINRMGDIESQLIEIDLFLKIVIHAILYDYEVRI